MTGIMVAAGCGVVVGFVLGCACTYRWATQALNDAIGKGLGW